MNSKKVLCLLGLVVVVGAVFIWRDGADQRASSRGGDTSSPVLNVIESESLSEASTRQVLLSDVASTANNKTVLFDALANQLKGRFERRLDNAYWRAKMVSDLMLLFQEKFPDNWRAELEAFFLHAFPTLADELLQTLEALLEYNQWLSELKSTMEFASLKERQAALWEKRVALFGDQAYVIWEAALKNEQLQEKLTKVDALVGDFSQKAELYITSMREVFGEEIIGEGTPHATQMMTKFLELDGVQEELLAMQSEDRYSQLREFRQAMGLDDAALDRWDTLDQQRDQMRTKGAIYMEEKANLSEQYQGAELEQKLTQYQNELFGLEEAKYIRNEESSGYYRFEQTQKYGIN